MLLRAVEEKRFLPLGSDKEVRGDFQLIAGTNRDLQTAVAEGKFREDLLARINMWTFRLPPLRDRREDIEPNLDYELDQFARTQGMKVTFNKEARELFLKFAGAADAIWAGNFRDLNAAVTRMATLTAGGRVTAQIVQGEINRLRSSWSLPAADQSGELDNLLNETALAEIDPFDRVQLAEVIRVCRANHTLSEAGRQLFAVSRMKKGTPNDADRLRKYLTRFGLDWARIRADD
jgi:transcriptional regulatory protein RtcR